MANSTSGYVAVFQVLSAEMDGVQHISDNVIQNTCPLFRIVKSRNAEVPEKYLGRAVESIANSWRGRGVAYVELIDTPVLDSLWAVDHSLVLIHRALSNEGVPTIPVVATHHLNDDHYKAVVTVAKGDKRGIGVRLYESDLEVPEETIKYIKKLAKDADTNLSSIDVLIDFERLLISRLPAIRALTLDFLSALDSSFNCRSVTVIGSSIPPDLDAIPHNSVRLIPRLEMVLWRQLVEARKERGIPRFGDHLITRADYVDVGGPFPNINAKILYTTNDGILIFRGQSRKKERLENQYTRLARSIINNKEIYSGRNFSWGDRLLDQYANGAMSSGTPSKFIAIGTSHHLTLVSAEVTEVALTV